MHTSSSCQPCRLPQQQYQGQIPTGTGYDKKNYSLTLCNGFTDKDRNEHIIFYTYIHTYIYIYIVYQFHIVSYISSLNGLSQHVHHIIPLTMSSFEAFCPAHQDSLKI